MKKRFSFLLISVILGMLAGGCGRKGKDGLAFLAIDWLYNPVSYWDNNPGIPETFYQGVYYEVNPGTYSFEYTAWDYSEYSGTYTLTVNEGEKGSWFKRGESGEDIHYKIWLYASGPELEIDDPAAAKEMKIAESMGLKPSENGCIEKNREQDRNTRFESNVYIIESHKGNMTLRIEFQRALSR
jgi:hypothetical protein